MSGPAAGDASALRRLHDSAMAVQVTIATEAVSLLGVTVGFSDNDGDSG